MLTARWNQARKLFTHDNLLAASLLDIVIAMTKGRPTATSTAPMIHRNKVADKILASDIVIPALMRNMFSPTLNSSWPIIILTRLFRYMIRAVSANVSTNEILVSARPYQRLDVGQNSWLLTARRLAARIRPALD